MGGISYLDFDLLIQRAAGRYRAQVNSPAGQAAVTFDLPFADLELENFLLKVGRPSRGTRRIDSPEVKTAKTFGERLFDAVFVDEVRGCLRSSIEEARREGGGVRIRLHLTDVPELADLPWEYLYNPALNRFLSLSVDTPVVRYLDLPERIQPLSVSPPLRVLVMISSPTDYPKLDVEREWAKLQEALRELTQRGLVAIERMTEPGLPELQRQLRRGTYHVFHFIGHGGFDQAAQDGVLVLEDESRRGRQVSGQDLGLMLHDHRSMRLAVLNACEGARTSRTDPFAGTAQSLVQQGLAAVIAMQFEITDEAAITFAHEFYGAVADGFPVDAASVEARKAIFAQDNGLEWGTPVLYLRAPDGRIFDVARVGAQPVTRGTAVTEAAPPVEVAPVLTYEITLAPPLQAGRIAGRFVVTLQNTGNLPGAFNLSADDPEHALAYRFKTTTPTVPPGGSMAIPLDVRPKRRRIAGRVSSQQISITASRVGTERPAQTATGTFVHRALMPAWAPAAAGLVAVVVGVFLLRAPRGAPEIERFVAQPTGIVQGAAVMLNWRVNNAGTVEISPPVSTMSLDPRQGQVSVTPAAPGAHTFTLVARRGGSSVRQTVTVTVRMRPPSIRTFTSAPEREGGRRAVLSWEVADATEARIEPQPGPVRLKGSILVDVPPPNQAVTYRLTARNPDNQPVEKMLLVAAGPRPPVVMQTPTVRVRPATVASASPPPVGRSLGRATATPRALMATPRASPPVRAAPEVREFSASPQAVNLGETAQLCWTTLNAQGARIEPEAGEVDSRDLLKGCRTISPKQTTTFTLTVTGADGRTVSSQVTVEVRPLEVHVDLVAAKPALIIGESTQLCWVLFNARSARLEPGVGDLAPSEIEKGCRSISPRQTTTYTLTVVGRDGRTVTKQLTVDVRIVEVQIKEFFARNAMLRPGDTTQLCWTVANARSLRIDPEPGELSRTELERGCREIAPRQTTTYFLTAVGPDGRTVTQRVLVAVALR